jgi:hypothetical protein
MSTPYTYLLKHVPTNTFYYGCRYAAGCNPLDFWVKYTTSSKKVKELIKRYGKDSFTFEIRKTFRDIDECRVWESKVLRRLKVVSRSDFINMADNISISIEAANRGRRNWKCTQRVLEHAAQMGANNKGRTHTNATNNLKGHPGNKHSLGRVDSGETRQKKSNARKGKPGNATSNQQPKCSCTVCHIQLTSSTIKRHHAYHH